MQFRPKFPRNESLRQERRIREAIQAGGGGLCFKSLVTISIRASSATHFKLYTHCIIPRSTVAAHILVI